jgi:diguanylate cyclase (GGDEF)-like protein/PAS domain S-box-containing protein
MGGNLARRESADNPSTASLEAQLRSVEAKYRSLVENLPAVVYTAEFGESGEWSYVSPQIADLLGFTAEEWLADRNLWFRQIHSADKSEALAKEEASRTTGAPLEAEYRMWTRSGETIWVRDEAAVVRDQAGDALFLQGVMVDISRRKDLESQLRHRTFHDALTGLANRALFLDRIDHAIARHGRTRTPITILVLDVDDFKIVNESLGHDAGDALLVEIAARLRRCLRPGDTVARIGGDEFAVLLEDLDEDGAEVVTTRVMEVLARPVDLRGNEVVTRVSIGIAESEAGEQGTELLSKADAAMYLAKGLGKGRHQRFDADLHAATVDRHRLRADLEKAIDRSEFVVHYQPIVEFATGRVTSLEALVRWQHPGRGLLFPDSFIGLAEETGAILPLGRWVLNEACRQTREWQEEWLGAPVAVSVNLSPRQVREPSLVADVEDALKTSGLAPGHLVLEITENVLLDRTSEVASSLRSLKERGVRIAIDDFGTGYSSLGYLRELPIDILKISKPFVDGLGKADPEGSALARSIIKLGDNLKMATVAEGIELAGQMSDLREFGCDYGQGFFLARPVSPPRVAGMMETLSLRLDGPEAMPASA